MCFSFFCLYVWRCVCVADGTIISMGLLCALRVVYHEQNTDEFMQLKVHAFNCTFAFTLWHPRVACVGRECCQKLMLYVCEMQCSIWLVWQHILAILQCTWFNGLTYHVHYHPFCCAPRITIIIIAISWSVTMSSAHVVQKLGQPFMKMKFHFQSGMIRL